jgi:prolyl-tRNA synthetase
MRWTKMMINTLREDPGDAEIDSHKLLVRAGLVKKLAGGLYTFLPLGLRTLHKVERIVREEMDRTGAQEILMPILQPAELWKQTGRWDTMGANMFRLTDRAEHQMAMGPTAEEEVTDLMANIISSYRQLPVTVYQIQTKFRDETRPRFGLMRSKEFIMKDAYSFDADAEAADKTYWTMYHAYERIFARCGLKATPVQADGGDMGDSMTHEFHALADAGEDGIASCPACGYAANLERAERKLAAAGTVAPHTGVAEAVPTPNARTIEEVAAFFGLPPSAFVKTLVYVADGKPVMVCVPGDRDVNEVKLKRFLKAKTVALADARTVEEVTGAPVGFAGPVKPAKADVPVYAESALEGASGVVVGANQTDTHLKNVDLARDAKITAYADLVICGAGDLCPKCGKPMELKRGIEVGQVFKLGTKYTDAFKAVYKNDQLKENVMIMGCYGVGVTRTMQAVVEQSHDKDGIIWPASVAPFQVVLDLLDPDNADVAKVAFDLEAQLEAAGIDVIVDDRAERPGVKFKDADLIGFPVRVVVGAKGLANGGVEIKRRDQPKEAMVKVAPEVALAAIQSALAG